jgi:hypothetical protein
MVAVKITESAITIQRHARGFITRLKVKQVKRLAEDFERAKLKELLGSMQATVNGFEETLHRKI